MKTFHAVFSLFLIITGTVVFLHTIVEPVYFTTTEEQPASPLWKIIEIHAAIALGIGIIYSILLVRNCNKNMALFERLQSNLYLSGFLFCSVIFFRVWFAGVLFRDTFKTMSPDVLMLGWLIFDSTMPILSISLGLHLLRKKVLNKVED